MLRLVSLGVNRAMPLPGGLKATTQFTILAMYCASAPDGTDDIPGSQYAHHHFDDWEALTQWVRSHPIGTPLESVH